MRNQGGRCSQGPAASPNKPAALSLKPLLPVGEEASGAVTAVTELMWLCVGMERCVRDLSTPLAR